MSWTRLKFAPGIVTDKTNYSSDGQWVDGSLVRFRQGLPERWMGWTRAFGTFVMDGICRSLHRWSDLTGFQWTGVGTNRRFYICSEESQYDVTPIRASETLGSNPIATTNASSTIQISYTAHGLLVGDVILISGAATTGGINATFINVEHQVSEYVDDDKFKIVVGASATSTTTGGGAAVVVESLYHAGGEDQIYGGGWGSLAWGEEEWGGDPALGSTDKIGIWSQDNWGEDLVANINKGPIFYWDATNPSDRMLNILSMSGADGNAPLHAEFVLVSHKDRHLLAFGASEYFTGLPAPMAVRWCSQENILNWDEADTTGTAGSLPFSIGSRLVAAAMTQQETVVFTDQAMYSLRYIGAPYIYGTDLISDFSDVLGLKALTIVDNAVYWLGRSGVYRYSGRVEKLNCPVWDYVSKRLDFTQANKVIVSTVRQYNEVIFHYQSTDESGGDDVDSYFAYNFIEDTWTIGQLGRSAWLDLDMLNNPLAADPFGDRLFYHETGADDTSRDPPVPLNAYIQSAPIELSSEGAFDKGDRFMFVRRILPDFSFRKYTDSVNSPSVELVLKTMDKPGGGYKDSTSSQVGRSVILPIEEFTDDLHVRLRGRALTIRIQNGSLGSNWRLGTPRIDARADGQR